MAVVNVLVVLFSLVALPLLAFFALWMGKSAVQGFADSELRRGCGWKVIVPMGIGCLMSMMLSVACIGLLVDVLAVFAPALA